MNHPEAGKCNRNSGSEFVVVQNHYVCAVVHLEAAVAFILGAFFI